MGLVRVCLGNGSGEKNGAGDKKAPGSLPPSQCCQPHRRACDPPDPACPRKGEEKPELLWLWLPGRGRKGSLPERAAPPAPPRFTPAPRGAEGRQSRARRRAELLAAWLGGRKGIKKKNPAAASLPPPPPLSPGKGAEEAGLPATSGEAGTES